MILITKTSVFQVDYILIIYIYICTSVVFSCMESTSYVLSFRIMFLY